MTEEQKSDIFIPAQQLAKPVRTLEALLKLYAEGHRNFSGSDLRGATVDIIDDEIENLNLQDIILRGSNLKAINLSRSRTLEVNLTGSDLSECNLQGAILYNNILDQCNFNYSDLRNVNLSCKSCRGSDFFKAKFSNISIGCNTDFTASDFTEADFRLTKLSGNFSYSKFCSSDFQEASFTNFAANGADFSNANLQNVKFPTPTTVSFQYAYYNSQTKLGDVDSVGRGMELIENDITSNDKEIC